MYANLCPEVLGIHISKPDDLIDLAVRHGFGGVDFPLDAVSTVGEARDLADILDAKGLKWGLFWMPCDFPSTDDANAAEGLGRLGRMLPILQAAGVTRTYNHVWPSSDTREYDDNFDWHVNRLRPVAKALADHGVNYGLEFIGSHHLLIEKSYPFVHTLEQAIALANAVGHGAGVVIDSFHWYTSGGTLAETRKALGSTSGSRIINVHLNDAVAGRSREDQLDGERMLPMDTGVIDIRGLMGLLNEVGYAGPVIVEPFEPSRSRMSRQSPDGAAAEVSAVMRKLFGWPPASSRQD